MYKQYIFITQSKTSLDDLKPKDIRMGHPCDQSEPIVAQMEALHALIAVLQVPNLLLIHPYSPHGVKSAFLLAMRPPVENWVVSCQVPVSLFALTPVTVSGSVAWVEPHKAEVL